MCNKEWRPNPHSLSFLFDSLALDTILKIKAWNWNQKDINIHWRAWTTQEHWRPRTTLKANNPVSWDCCPCGRDEITHFPLSYLQWTDKCFSHIADWHFLHILQPVWQIIFSPIYKICTCYELGRNKSALFIHWTVISPK